VKGLRVGVPTTFFNDDLDPGVGAALTESIKALESLGCAIVPVTLPAEMAAFDAAGTHVIAAEAAAYHGNWLRTRPQDYSPQVRARLERGLALPATRYIDALRLRGPATAAFAKAVFAKVDVLHAPVLPIPTPTIAETDVGGSPTMDRTLALMTRFTRPFSYLGMPSLAVPCGFLASGLPASMQLVGRPFDEATILALGHAFQQATDWHKREPKV
jgi:aspartyl-tRNA(Asn)/glutamyl-tRNA(Gln) amidotransferase subunit A